MLKRLGGSRRQRLSTLCCWLPSVEKAAVAGWIRARSPKWKTIRSHLINLRGVACSRRLEMVKALVCPRFTLFPSAWLHFEICCAGASTAQRCSGRRH